MTGFAVKFDTISCQSLPVPRGRRETTPPASASPHKCKRPRSGLPPAEAAKKCRVDYRREGPPMDGQASGCRSGFPRRGHDRPSRGSGPSNQVWLLGWFCGPLIGSRPAPPTVGAISSASRLTHWNHPSAIPLDCSAAKCSFRLAPPFGRRGAVLARSVRAMIPNSCPHGVLAFRSQETGVYLSEALGSPQGDHG